MIRVGVVDFDNSQLPLMKLLEPRLRPAIELHYFQTRGDTLPLLADRRERVWMHGAEAAAPCELGDAELIAACGATQVQLAHDMPALLRQAREAAAQLAAFLERHRIDTVLLWNGATLFSALAAQLARARGITAVYGDNGYLPGTLQMDAEGVNYFSSHTRRIARQEYLQLAPSAAFEAVLPRLRNGEPPPQRQPLLEPRAPAAARLRRELGRLFRREAWTWPATLLRRPIRHDHAPLPQRFVLLALQVRNNEQHVLHSPLFGVDLHSLVTRSWYAMRQALPRHRLVVKLHPAEQPHIQRGYNRLARRIPDLLLMERRPMRELIRACDAMITVNSTSGVEALLQDKPVVALGRNFYTAPQLVHHVESLDGYAQALRNALAQPLDAQARRRFLQYCHEVMLVQGSLRDGSEPSLAAVAARLMALARARGQDIATVILSAAKDPNRSAPGESWSDPSLRSG